MAVTMRATLADVASNARVKDYPSLEVFQVANAPIFRKPGYEPRKRPYDVPPKGEALRTQSVPRRPAGPVQRPL